MTTLKFITGTVYSMKASHDKKCTCSKKKNILPSKNLEMVKILDTTIYRYVNVLHVFLVTRNLERYL